MRVVGVKFGEAAIAAVVANGEIGRLRKRWAWIIWDIGWYRVSLAVAMHTVYSPLKTVWDPYDLSPSFTTLSSLRPSLYPPGIPSVVVIDAVSTASRHLAHIEHPDNFFKTVHDVW
jgi:hypothetical protein